MKKIIIAAALTGLALNAYAAKPEWAGNSEGKKEHKSQVKMDKKLNKKEPAALLGSGAIVSETESILEDIFTSDERETIKKFYNENAHSGTGKHKGKMKELPHGLQKKLERGGELPPGWQKKLARGEVLDPELRYQSNSLPDELLSRLPNQRAATEIIKLKDKVIRVGKGEGTIVDIIDLADILIRTGQ